MSHSKIVICWDCGLPGHFPGDIGQCRAAYADASADARWAVTGDAGDPRDA